MISLQNTTTRKGERNKMQRPRFPSDFDIVDKFFISFLVGTFLFLICLAIYSIIIWFLTNPIEHVIELTRGILVILLWIILTMASWIYFDTPEKKSKEEL